MKIKSIFTRGIISKLIAKTLRKKLGYNIDIQIRNLQASVVDGKTCVHLDVDFEIDKEELMKIIANVM